MASSPHPLPRPPLDKIDVTRITKSAAAMVLSLHSKGTPVDLCLS